MTKGKIYLLGLDKAKKLGMEEWYEDGKINSYPFMLESKTKKKPKSGEHYTYKWSICLAPKIYIHFGEHDVELKNVEKYEKMWKLAVREGIKQEYIDLDKQVLEALEMGVYVIKNQELGI